MCTCQSFGKSGLPWPSGKCMVCGEQVDPAVAVIVGAGDAPAPAGITSAERLVRELEAMVDTLQRLRSDRSWAPSAAATLATAELQLRATLLELERTRRG